MDLSKYNLNLEKMMTRLEILQVKEQRLIRIIKHMKEIM
jgi:hypothetical protein